jgi:WD40 repeat protein
VEKERTFHCDELAVGTLCGQVVIFKMAQGGQLLECARTQYRTKAITCLQYAPTGTLLAVASEDMVVDVFLPDENHRRVGVCKGHMAPIMSIDWTEDGEFMQTSDTALELMFWCMQTRTEKTVPEFVSHSKPILLYKKQWANYTTPLGWPWHGIYTPGSEGVGLNAVHRLILDRQSKKALGVSASANGVVKLFPYPNQPGMSGMQAQTYEGHSAAVSKVRFSAKGDYVVSVGGRDCTIIQWEVLAPTKELGALDADAGQGKATASDDDDSEDELDRLQREGAVKKLTADQQYNEKGRSM